MKSDLENYMDDLLLDSYDYIGSMDIGWTAHRVELPSVDASAALFHVFGVPGAGYDWQSEPLASVENDYTSRAIADAVATILQVFGIVPSAKVQELEPSPMRQELSALWEQEYDAPLPADTYGLIIIHDDRGFTDWETFASEQELDARWQELEQEETEQSGPREDDYALEPTGSLGAQTAVSQYGKHLGDFPDDQSALRFVRVHMRCEQFFPNVWMLSDHGNAHLVDMSEQEQASRA